MGGGEVGWGEGVTLIPVSSTVVASVQQIRGQPGLSGCGFITPLRWMEAVFFSSSSSSGVISLCYFAIFHLIPLLIGFLATEKKQLGCRCLL